MPTFGIVGGLGSGKGLAAAWQIRQAILAGVPVATNMDLRLEKLLPQWFQLKAPVYRLPDYPRPEDLHAIGLGAEHLDESRYGVLVLDELANWMNARTWGGDVRQQLLDWFVHSRKLGWNVYFIVQNLNMLDKQLREALIEHRVAMRRMDRLKIPFLPLKFPRVHVGTVRYGIAHDAPVVGRWMFRGDGFWDGYDTKQVFRQYSAAPSAFPQVGAVSEYRSPHSMTRAKAPLGALERFRLWLKGPAKKRAPARSWPESVARLPADLRWQIARRLFSASQAA